jgi:hypothetical protein
MPVYCIFQIATPGHNTSYRTGKNWVASCDTLEEAESKAETFNHYRSPQCIGIEYVVEGPMNEEIDVCH